jgi:hypothetical protein
MRCWEMFKVQSSMFKVGCGKGLGGTKIRSGFQVPSWERGALGVTGWEALWDCSMFKVECRVLKKGRFGMECSVRRGESSAILLFSLTLRTSTRDSEPGTR